ncbi:MAG: septum formation inhibitor Maf [Frankiales bacterium]|nr:septum formation inhibitor Maf [Frankiales bacterium]
MATRTLVLASASPARLAVLRAAGFAPEVVVSGVDEPAYEGGDTRAYVRELAERKARAVVGKVGAGAIVIGCDSMLELDGELMGKPASPEQAVQRWQAMRGQTGMLLTGHCLIDTLTSTLVADTALTEVQFGSPSDAEIAAYVATGEPLAVAGGFTLDGRSGAYVTGIVGDHGNVLGLSLPMLRALLGQLDVALHELWV